MVIKFVNLTNNTNTLKMKQEYKTVSKYFLKETTISDEDTNYKHKSKSVAIKNQHTISLKSKQGMT